MRKHRFDKVGDRIRLDNGMEIVTLSRGKRPEIGLIISEPIGEYARPHFFPEGSENEAKPLDAETLACAESASD